MGASFLETLRSQNLERIYNSVLIVVVVIIMVYNDINITI